MDTEGTIIKDLDTPVFEGSTVKLGFIQKPYILRDNTTYGTSLKLSGVQVVSVKGQAGIDAGDLNEEEIAGLFGKTKGFKSGDPNVVVDTAPSSVEDDDF